MIVKIDLESVGTSPKPLELRLGADEIDLDEQGKPIDGVAFLGETFRDGPKVHLRGKISAELETVCTRCLEPVARHFDIAFDDVFVDASEEPTADEIELAADDLDESLVIGGSVDLADIVREQIILEMPAAILCRDDCKGLCEKCGMNRNLVDCSCARDEIDPRWAALKNLN